MYNCSYGMRNLVLLICFLRVPLCCALDHIHVCYLGCALHMPSGGCCFLCTGCVLDSVMAQCTTQLNQSKGPLCAL
jgi:hypothetical protein